MTVAMSDFSLQLRVYIGDTDAGGVVYYANYLDYMERARTESLRALGIDLDDWQQRLRRLFVVRSVRIDYLKPARFNDLLDVHVQISELRRASLICEQQVTRGQETLATASVRLACINADTLATAAIPESLKEAMTREF